MSETIVVRESTKGNAHTLRYGPEARTQSARGATERQSESDLLEEFRPRMRVCNILRGLAAAALLALIPGTAQSQSIPSPFRYMETSQEVGIFAGAAFMNQGRFGFGPKGGTEFGARWGIDLSGPLGFEMVAAGISGTRTVINPAKVVGDNNIGDADSFIGTVDARLRFTFTGDRTWHQLAPFFIAGGGLAFDMSPDAALDQEILPEDRFSFGTGFIGTLGAGARLVVSDRWALRGDAVFSLWKIDTPPGFAQPGRGFEGVAKSEWAGGMHYTVTAMLRF